MENVLGIYFAFITLFIFFFIHEIFLFLILFWSYVVKIFVQLYFVIDSTKSISFYGWLLNPMGIHLLWYAHGGERTASHVAVHDVFVSIAKDARFYVFWKQTTFFRHLFFRLFVGGWHCSIGWWHHYQPHSNRFGIMGDSFLQGADDNGNSNEGRTLL